MKVLNGGGVTEGFRTRSIEIRIFKLQVEGFRKCLRRHISLYLRRIILRMQLIGIAEAIEQISRSPLTSKSDVDKQLKILKASSIRLSEIDSQLEELKEIVNLICQITQDHSLQTDIREQLNTTIQTAQELNKKIGKC